MSKDPTLSDTLLSQSDVKTTQIEENHQKYLDDLPEVYGGSIFSKLFFTWLNPFFSYGARQEITVDEVPRLPK